MASLSFHSSVLRALDNDPDALHALKQKLPKSTHRCRALPLPPPSNIPLDPQSPAFDSESSTPLLLGRIISDGKAALCISHSRKEFAALVVVPPLSVRYRSALVWIQDWRLVRSSNLAHCVFEVFLNHVCVLVFSPHYVLPSSQNPLHLSHINNPHSRIDLIAEIREKSPPISTNTDRHCFLLEIVDIEEKEEKKCAAYVVFQGRNPAAWWPFLHVSQTVALLNVRLGELPGFNNKKLFFVKDGVTKVCSSSDPSKSTKAVSSPSVSPIRKRMRFTNKSSNAWMTMPSQNSFSRITSFYCSNRPITYEGMITDVLSDGRYELDDCIFLHLGATYDWCAGGHQASLCFRPGTRIEARNVHIAFQRGEPSTLYPSARTVISILYFGTTDGDGCVSYVREWRTCPWHFYWRQLAPEHVLWAQEIYDALKTKFRSWLESTQGNSKIANENDMCVKLADSMLGSRKEPGLVQYVMETLTESNNLFSTPNHRSNLYAEFMGLTKKRSNNSHMFHLPYLATIREVSSAADFMWESSGSLHAAETAQRDEDNRIFSQVFSSEELGKEMFTLGRATNSPLHANAATKLQLSSSVYSEITLVALLEGGNNINTETELSDETGSLSVVATSPIDPSLLGAVILVRKFSVAVECSFSLSLQQKTLVFDPRDVTVIVDGPYISDAHASPSVSEKACRTEHRAIQRGFQDSQQILRLGVSEDDESNAQTCDVSQECGAIEECPIAAIFVQSVGSIIQHSDGQPRFSVEGRLLAFCSSTQDERWNPLDNEREGFWACCLVIHGQAAVKIRPALIEGRLYGVGCTDFSSCQNIADVCKSRALRNGAPYVVLLFTESEDKVLWVQDLHQGLYMRFNDSSSQAVSNLKDTLAHNGIVEIVGEQSAEGASFMRITEAIAQYQNDFNAKSFPSFFCVSCPYWNPIVGEKSPLQSRLESEELVSVSGQVLRCDFVPANESMHLQRQAKMLGFRLTLRDNTFSLLKIEILLPGFATPRALIPGVRVRLVHVNRKVCDLSSTVLLTGCRRTRIHHWPKLEGKEDSLPSLCCHRPLSSLAKIFSSFPQCFLWEFCRANAGNGTMRSSSISANIGIIRVNIIEVKSLEFFQVNDFPGCSFCRSHTKERSCIGARACATIEDGTTFGDVYFDTFQSVMELLGSTEDDSVVFRKTSLPWKFTQRDLAACRDGNMVRLAAANEHQTTLQKLLYSCRRSVHVLARNQTVMPRSALRRVDPTIRGEVQVMQTRFGYRQSTRTMKAPYMHVVQLQGLAVFEEAWTDNGQNSVANILSSRNRFEMYVHR